jgi:hypothetical protein
VNPRALNAHRSIKTGELREPTPVRDPAGAGLPILHPRDIPIYQRAEHFRGAPPAGSSNRGRVRRFGPAGLAVPELIDCLPPHLQPCQRHSLLAYLEARVDELDEHLGVFATQLEHFDFDDPSHAGLAASMMASWIEAIKQ